MGAAGIVMSGLLVGILSTVLCIYVGFLIFHSIPKESRKGLYSGWVLLLVTILFSILLELLTFTVKPWNWIYSDATKIFVCFFLLVAIFGIAGLTASFLQRALWSICSSERYKLSNKAAHPTTDPP